MSGNVLLRGDYLRSSGPQAPLTLSFALLRRGHCVMQGSVASIQAPRSSQEIAFSCPEIW
ncbi:hypothetical protein LCGC14_1553030 [marine sediment metagenome]|uniref:Uncharacterized protein n=1 Tax=marine sediment metagenome TaxID=412755 RepID=A0A0F9IPV0_9ZZZZ